MSNPGIAKHWQFATSNAIKALERHILEFNFEHTARHHAYGGASPSLYLEIIDGFLSEPPEIVPGGNRNTLNGIRTRIVKQLDPAFQAGIIRGCADWQASPRIWGQLEPEEYRQMARQAGPTDALELEWFMEGYCQAWAKAEFEEEVLTIRQQSHGGQSEGL